MNSLKKISDKLLAIVLLLSVSVIYAQSSKESFDVSGDVLVSVNTSHTNVVFETWNKDKVEVEAFIDDDKLSTKEKKAIFDKWNLDVLGNSKKVVITSNEGSLWGGIESAGSLRALERLGELESLEALKGLDALKGLKDMPIMEGLKDLEFNISVPDVPELMDFPIWPFSRQRPNFKDGDGYNYYNDRNKKSYTFDRGEYERNKQKYVDKLNDKYDTNVSVRQVDSWLDDVDAWSEEVEREMEKWGEEFGKDMEKWGEEFGEKFGAEMEEWGEKFGKDMEKWGEEFGEKFGAEMEKWGEEFGKDMEKWAEEFEKDAEKWAEKYDDDGNRTIIIDRDGKGLFDEGAVKAKKTIIIRMPKGTRTDINVRYGEVKMADARNIKANLNYAKLTANSIDGGKTLINAAYAPVYVNYWKNGMLDLKFVEDCKLNNVAKINLEANSSDVNINSLSEEAFLSGSFGNLFINTITDDFRSVDIVLENTDATLSMPKTAFDFYFNGKKSRFQSPANLVLTTKNKSDSRSLLKGHYRNSNSGRSVTINASYSNVNISN